VTRIPGIPTIRAMAALAALAALAGASLACAENAFAPTSVGGAAGSATAIAHWQIQSSAKAQQSGAEVSSAGYSTRDWYPVSGPRDSDGGTAGEWHVQERVLWR